VPNHNAAQAWLIHQELRFQDMHSHTHNQALRAQNVLLKVNVVPL
jgi:hypothetical protein